jgi:hypothetical protein
VKPTISQSMLVTRWRVVLYRPRLTSSTVND